MNEDERVNKTTTKIRSERCRGTDRRTRKKGKNENEEREKEKNVINGTMC